MKSVSGGESGSMQIVTPQAATAGIARRNVSDRPVEGLRLRHAGQQRRCLGDPNTIRSPPRSPHGFGQRDEVVGRARAHRGVG